MIFKQFREDVAAVRSRDPAARTSVEVVLCYPGVHALWFHRVSHGLWRWGWKLPARLVSQLSRWVTGIEIHPGASIGKRFFIDHGMGVVIGETAIVGDDVTLYQGVTLGGTSLERGKRHPTLEDGVIVGAGAKILGPLTIGARARIGSNAVVLRDVAAGTTVVGIPARAATERSKVENLGFCAYGSSGDLPDPVARAMDSLCGDLERLQRRVAELEATVEQLEDDADRPRKVSVGGV